MVSRGRVRVYLGYAICFSFFQEGVYVVGLVYGICYGLFNYHLFVEDVLHVFYRLARVVSVVLCGDLRVCFVEDLLRLFRRQLRVYGCFFCVVGRVIPPLHWGV